MLPDPVVESLVLDLLEWVASEPRPYAEVMDAWRTSCPRLPVWEEASERGLLTSHVEPGRGLVVGPSALGTMYLSTQRPTRI